MKTLILALAISGPLRAGVAAHAGTNTASVRAQIDAGNQAWIDGMKTGKVSLISVTYAENAVDCGPAGGCISGRRRIAQHMTSLLARLGRARSASVKTWGTTRQGNFVYEWGQAEATFGDGKNLVEKYLTVWQAQPDGSWKIFRNMVIPEH